MFTPIRIARLFGIPLEVRVSFLVMLGAVLLFLGGLSGLFVVLLAFSSVVLHELGHALAARRLGVFVSGIELHFFGGVAKLANQPKSERDEIAIAAAGPAVSFILAAASGLLYWATGLGVFELIAIVNLVIAVFNLIPALPMDGGRILRAILSIRVGHRRATEHSVRVSRGISIAFVVLGLAFAQLQLILLAGVLWVMASSELKMAGLSRTPHTTSSRSDSGLQPEVIIGGIPMRRYPPSHPLHDREQSPRVIVFYDIEG